MATRTHSRLGWTACAIFAVFVGLVFVEFLLGGRYKEHFETWEVAPVYPLHAYQNLRPRDVEDRAPDLLLLMFHTCEAFYKTRFKAAKQTWLRKDRWPWGLVVYTSGPIISERGMHKDTDADTNADTAMTMVRVTDSMRPGSPPEGAWRMNERVVQSFIHAYITQPVHEWYFKVDDDTYVSVEELRKFNFSAYPDPMNTAYYIGNCVDCPSFGARDKHCKAEPNYDCSVVTHPYSYACGGPGYLLSRKALELFVLGEWTHGWPRLHEDRMVGYAMDVHRVPCTHDSRFLFVLEDKDMEKCLKKETNGQHKLRGRLSIHKVLSKHMLRLHSTLSKTTSTVAESPKSMFQ